MPAPGGGWDVTDNGSYTVLMLANEVSDTFGNFVAAGSLGSFAVAFSDTAPPTAVLTAPGVTAPIAAGGAYYFTAAYVDNTAVPQPVAGGVGVVSDVVIVPEALRKSQFVGGAGELLA